MESDNNNYNKIAQYYNIDKNNILDVSQIKIPLHAFILLIAKRRAGKSILAKDLIKKICDDYNIDYICVFSNTARFNGDYDFVKKNCIFEFKDCQTKLDKIIKYQIQKKKSGKNVPNAIIVIDDPTIYKKCNPIIDIASYGRHINIFLIISCQHAKEIITTSIRNNLDLVFFNDINFTNAEAIYKCMHVNFYLRDLIDFIEYVNDGNHMFIMYNNNEKDKHDRIKLVKAKLYDSIKIVNKDKNEINNL